MVGMSKFSFIRLFKLSFGLSPYQYIRQKRLFRAESLFQKGKPIFEVAHETCFADTPLFSKAFKLHFGYSPSRM